MRGIVMKMLFKFKNYYLIAIAFLASTTTSLALAGDAVDEMKILEDSRPFIIEMESKLKLPESSYPLSSYSRFYSVTVANGHQKIVGQYRYNPEHAGIHLVKFKELPRTMDGGCSVIHIEFDLEKKSLLSVNCGGVA